MYAYVHYTCICMYVYVCVCETSGAQPTRLDTTGMAPADVSQSEPGGWADAMETSRLRANRPRRNAGASYFS